MGLPRREKAMKKIINGKKYDTKTATLLASCQYSHPFDFNHYIEELYQKKTGEFFLHGQGGSHSKYCELYGGTNSWNGGSKIIPFTRDEAKKWAEKFLDADKCKKIFSDKE